MVSQLVMHERIETTLPKAKELRKLADRVVTLGKEVSLCPGAAFIHDCAVIYSTLSDGASSPDMVQHPH